MNDKLRPNEVQLFGQRFHACVAVFYLGLGLLLGDAVHRWFADAALWLPLVGLATLLAAGETVGQAGKLTTHPILHKELLS
jgi:hypothetical protein